MAGLFDNVYNPDVLSCLANLSSDEVFTPPEVANKMLDMLPQELFSNPDTKFLDPACKSGVFLREIVKRLLVGLENQIPDIQQRINHIMHDMVYGIAITELTSLIARRSLYCSKNASGKFSVARFDNVDGNIRYKLVRHTWENGKCIYCGASQASNDRPDELESHAYEFIHWLKPEEIFGMKFDVVVSNPPYQLNNGSGLGQGAIPIYHKFIEQAKKLNPKYITMITPSRWFSGGLGLDDFRKSMLSDNNMKEIVDYLNSTECFAGVEIKGGVSYFLWENGHSGDCSVTTIKDGKIESKMVRPMKESGCDIFIRYNEGISILRKVRAFNEDSYCKLISSTNPFNLGTTFTGKTKKDDSIKTYSRGRNVIYADKGDYTRNLDMLKQHKILISSGYNGGDKFPHQIINKPFYAEPGSGCTATYLVITGFKSEEECRNAITYMNTKFFRFLVLLKKISQHAPKDTYSFVPMQDFNRSWSDEDLYVKYGLDAYEIQFIESMIRPMGLGGDD